MTFFGLVSAVAIALLGRHVAALTCTCCTWRDSCRCEAHCELHPFEAPRARLVTRRSRR